MTALELMSDEEMRFCRRWKPKRAILRKKFLCFGFRSAVIKF
jgi:hypothetical protein